MILNKAWDKEGSYTQQQGCSWHVSVKVLHDLCLDNCRKRRSPRRGNKPFRWKRMA